MGATAPEEMGNHYAWGEIASKTDYSGQTCLTDGKKLDLISGNAEYDAATALWGAPSRVPTEEEFDELLANCTNEWVTINGTPGRRFTSNKNGKSIFLPAAGRWFETNYFGKKSDGRYWAGTSYG